MAEAGDPQRERFDMTAQGDRPRLSIDDVERHWQEVERDRDDPIRLVERHADHVLVRFADGDTIRDDGNGIAIVGRMTRSRARTMIDAAARHGWKEVTLRGTLDARKLLAEEAIARGLKVLNPELLQHIEATQRRHTQSQPSAPSPISQNLADHLDIGSVDAFAKLMDDYKILMADPKSCAADRAAVRGELIDQATAIINAGVDDVGPEIQQWADRADAQQDTPAPQMSA